MPEYLRFCLVDAFAERPFQGNAAGVVFNADALSESQMQRIAREVNVSETAFISRANDLHRPTRIRWFTPTVEVGFCGHATLATAHALHDTGCLAGVTLSADAPLVLDSAAGELRLTAEPLTDAESQLIWWLDMPVGELKPDHTNPLKTCELLDISIDELDAALPVMRTRDNDLIMFVRTWQTLTSVKPRFDELGRWCERHDIRGICVATTNTVADSLSVQSRFFAPAAGINEDPVTGSVHGPLATYLVINGLVGSAGNRSALFCAQGTPGDRSGLVRALVESTAKGYRVRVGGLCFTTIEGEIRVPTAD